MRNVDVKVGDIIEITHGGYGTYSENIGCRAEVLSVDGVGNIDVSQKTFICKDECPIHYIYPEAYKVVERKNHQLSYEIF